MTTHLHTTTPASRPASRPTSGLIRGPRTTTSAEHVLVIGRHRLSITLRAGAPVKVRCAEATTRTGWHTLFPLDPTPVRTTIEQFPLAPTEFVTLLAAHLTHDEPAAAARLTGPEMFLAALLPKEGLWAEDLIGHLSDLYATGKANQ